MPTPLCIASLPTGRLRSTQVLTKLLSLRERFGPLLSSVTGMMGGGGPSEDQILGKIDELKGARPRRRGS